MRSLSVLLISSMCLFASVAHAESLAEKIASGKSCFVEFKTFKNPKPSCHGTLARGIAYTLTYDLNTGLYRGVGHICDTGKNNDHSDVGPHSSSGMFAIWGARWRFDEAGNVYYPEDTSQKSSIGEIKC